jgi:hypothetical protein
MHSQSLHFLALGFLHGRVIPNQIPCHDVLLGRFRRLGASRRCRCSSASTIGPIPLESVSTTALPRRWFHTGLPSGNGSALPDSDSRQPDATGPSRSTSLTEHQPQQDDHEVLILRLAQVVTEPFGEVAQVRVQTYNGDRNGTPPWLKGFLFTFLIPHGVLSSNPSLKKCKHRGMMIWERLVL